PFNAGIYEEECMALLDKLFVKNKIVVLSGGSGLYINAVLFGHDELPPANDEIRQKLIKSYEDNGIAVLQKELKAADPVYFEEVDQLNPQRLMRALEVCKQTGKPYSSFRKSTPKKRNFNHLIIAINEDRESLYTRINQRVDEMMNEGLLDEVKSLHPYKHLNAVQTVGYTELFIHLDKQYTLDEAVDKIKQHSRNYAKRQITWIKKYDEVHWVNRNETQKIIQLIDAHLQ
ncbi:MAG: tRNA (adenosine(37)-N6)-dimethylallyltransferase MiaA, partial [Bacteroidia bacterium]|nr:tRNA (adenosine(37)-N6)-dimethylallyltransferase MiaA [Bacteroidia bacterium]